jgi:hypothetical protein
VTPLDGPWSFNIPTTLLVSVCAVILQVLKSRFCQSDSVYSAAGDLGLHHGLDVLFALTCDANGELIERGHHRVMIEVNNTGDSSETEVQVFKFFQFPNGRWNSCNTQNKSAITG